VAWGAGGSGKKRKAPAPPAARKARNTDHLTLDDGAFNSSQQINAGMGSRVDQGACRCSHSHAAACLHAH
jgi:hypothetical protein